MVRTAVLGRPHPGQVGKPSTAVSAAKSPGQRRSPNSTDQTGRGLFAVNRIARRWGVSRLSTGKVVWFELTLPDGLRPG